MNNLTKDQIVTVGDLEIMKSEILDSIRRIGKEKNIHSPVVKWMKSAEVGALLGFSPRKLQALRESGIFAFTKIGGNIYYDPEDLKKLLSENLIQQKKWSIEMEGTGRHVLPQFDHVRIYFLQKLQTEEV